MIARGWAAFKDFWGTSTCIRLPFPLQASEIPSHIEPVALYGIELRVLVPNAERGLNQMQVGWAKALLGISDCRQGLWPILVCECGWTCRLGTVMLVRAIMLKARIQLLQATHPASQLLLIASASDAHT